MTKSRQKAIILIKNKMFKSNIGHDFFHFLKYPVNLKLP